MKLVRKILARGRLKTARQRLAQDPSPRTYANLAQQYAQLGLSREVHRVCQEGLKLFPGNAQLVRLGDRAQRLEREERTNELKRELAEAPRPALWAEMCEMLLDSGRFARAEEVANEWLKATGDQEARLTIARIARDAFLADRGREQGRRAVTALEEAIAAQPNDDRARRLLLDLLSRIGAWRDARKVASELLQLKPGDSELESRYRVLEQKADKSPTLQHALVEVENSGRFADEDEEANRRSTGGSVKPLLQALAEQDDVEAALYLRGSTVLVQGLKGATADRFARAVRSLLTGGRTTGRKLGLGQIFAVRLEGDFGTLGIAPGELDAGALWTTGALRGERENALMGLAGLNADMSEVTA
jgi:tetratricopeptide (TPR) repeat protein